VVVAGNNQLLVLSLGDALKRLALRSQHTVDLVDERAALRQPGSMLCDQLLRGLHLVTLLADQLSRLVHGIQRAHGCNSAYRETDGLARLALIGVVGYDVHAPAGPGLDESKREEQDKRPRRADPHVS